MARRTFARQAWRHCSRKTVLTFAGYSGAEYEEPKAMLAHASRILAGRNPADTMIKARGTAAGIGVKITPLLREGERSFA